MADCGVYTTLLRPREISLFHVIKGWPIADHLRPIRTDVGKILTNQRLPFLRINSRDLPGVPGATFAVVKECTSAVHELLIRGFPETQLELSQHDIVWDDARAAQKLRGWVNEPLCLRIWYFYRTRWLRIPYFYFVLHFRHTCKWKLSSSNIVSRKSRGFFSADSHAILGHACSDFSSDHEVVKKSPTQHIFRVLFILYISAKMISLLKLRNNVVNPRNILIK